MKRTYQRVCFDWLAESRNRILRNEATISDIIKNAELSDPNEVRSIGRQTYEDAVKYYGLEPISSGRRKAEYDEIAISDIIIDYRQKSIKVGITKTYKMIKRDYPNVNISLEVIHDIYQKYGWLSKTFKKTKKNRCRYEALLCNGIWHVDVHYPNQDPDNYVYGIIDDKSRFIIGLSLIQSKTASVCADLFQQAITKYGPPAICWSDNGGENIGNVFRRMLQDNGVGYITTEPYTPQQNGKVERLWRSYEKMCSSTPLSLEQFVHNYNNIIPHTSIDYLCPCDVYNDLNLRWKPGMPIQYMVDNQIKNLKINSL